MLPKSDSKVEVTDLFFIKLRNPLATDKKKIISLLHNWDLPADPSDRSFVNRFFKLQPQILPTDSNIYSLLPKLYKEDRRDYEKRLAKKMDRPLPQATVNYFNKQFATVDTYMKFIIEELSIPPRFKARTLSIYAYRLQKQAHLRNLLDSDVFSGQTVTMDLPPSWEKKDSKILLTERERDPLGEFTKTTLHFILHRAQHTEFLFLHEFIVGHLVNSMCPSGFQISRASLKVDSNYWATSSLAFNSFAQFLGMTQAELLGLNFVDRDYILNSLPPSVIELLNLCAHVTFYVEVANGKFIGQGTSSFLVLVYSIFFLGLLERMRRGAQLIAVDKASKIIDRMFVEQFINPPKGTELEVNQFDQIALLNDLVALICPVPSQHKATRKAA